MDIVLISYTEKASITAIELSRNPIARTKDNHQMEYHDKYIFCSATNRELGSKSTDLTLFTVDSKQDEISNSHLILT